MAKQTVTALFETRDDAAAAIETLVAMGVSRADLRMTPDQDMATTDAPSTRYDTQNDEKGFWRSLGDLFIPDDDRRTYAEAMHRGDILVTASVAETDYDRVADALEASGAIEIDERENAYRQTGWLGDAGLATADEHDSPARPGERASGVADAFGAAIAPDGVPTAGATMGDGAMSAVAGSGRDEVVPVVSERLTVGKRVVQGGRVRIRSYVVETPVSEDVSLHSERVHVERHAVDRPVAPGEDLFRERSLEATESAEEAVVAKEARVTEEVRLSRDSGDRTETISDTVRETRVEVEDERTDAARMANRP